ncbi:MAG: amino acid adenylation domain-containing protein [Ignavibacteriales bacterium]|nr:MAG: amino acid adenylation domain-containing protein [Ignavibacteriales bacterium]
MTDHNQVTPTNEVYAFPASYAQQQLWFLHMVDPDSAVYNIPFAFKLKGKVNISALEQSINEIIHRHETFRTTFALAEGALQQYIASELFLPLKVHDLREKTDKKLLADQIIKNHTIAPFNLFTGPLIKSGIILTEDDESILLFNFHHIILDHTSVLAFTNELTEIYKAKINNRNHSLPEPSIQYADMVIWQREEAQIAAVNEKLAYWKSQLEGQLQFLDLPTDRQRPSRQTFVGAERKVKFSKELSEQIREFSRREKKSLFVVLLTTFKILFHRYTNKTDITVGCPFANRNQPGLEEVMGCCMNTLPLRTSFSETDSFKQVLDKVRDVTLGAHSNQEVSFEQIVEQLHPMRDGSFNPLFQVSFMFQDPPMKLYLEGLECESFEVHSGTSKFDCTLWMWDDEEGISGLFEYNTDLFEESTIDRMFSNFSTLLRGIVNNPETSVAKLTVLSADEKELTLKSWNETSFEYPSDKTIHQLFENIAEQYPDKTAVEFREETISYKELNERANQLAFYLAEHGVKQESLVGIYLERSIEMVVALLGIMKAGGAYVPMDPLFPQDRLAYMLEDAGIQTLVTQNSLSGSFAGFKGKEILIDTEKRKIQEKEKTNPSVKSNSSNLAYVIYTSGSTGKPKGVQIEQRAVVNFLVSMLKEPGLTNTDVLLSVTTLSFDIAGLEIYLPLIAGAKVLLVPKETSLDGKALINLIKTKSVTVMQATPSTWRLMLAANWDKQLGIKILCGGEALPAELASDLIKREKLLWNMYGPTETTIWSAVKKIDNENGPVLIGKPIANTQFYILDKNNQPVPIGVAGELHIGGDGLARGYLNRPELTNEKFIKNPFTNGESRIYKTGDLVRWRSDGFIEFLGRLDHQVKVRGFRIELGEIESALGNHPEIKQAVVTVFQPVSGDTRIVAYLIPTNGRNPVTNDLRDFLRISLPEYMIPAHYEFLSEFPLTPNGKIDRKALPEPSASKTESTGEFNGPRDEIEIQLTALWEKMLKVKPIGIKDNFFELGGHSLLAAQLFANIEKIFGVNIPLAILFQAPTIELLANIIKEKDHKKLWSSLVPIQPNGTKPPLYLVHGAEGNVLLYRELANQLGKDQPVYGLQSRGLDGQYDMHTKFEEMAADYINEIKSLQPDGPYYLAGYCLGGAIAFEMAQQLKSNGDEIAFLGMLETYNIKSNCNQLPPFQKYYSTIENVVFHFQNAYSIRSGERKKFLFEKFTIELNRIKMKWGLFKNKIAGKFRPDEVLKYHHLQIDKINDKAQADYEPRLYPGKIKLYKPKKDFTGYTDEKFGWGNLAAEGVDITTLPIYPRGMLVEPYVQLLAAQLKADMDKAAQNK